MKAKRVRQVLDDCDLVLQGTVTLDGVDCLGAYFGDHIKISIAPHSNADEMVVTLLHEVAHAMGYNESQVRALEKSLYRRPSIRWEAARALLNAFIDLWKRRRT